jgi:hypothetical protein
MAAIATKLGQLITPPCIQGKIQNDSNGNPMCSVIENVENNNVYQRTAIPNCNANGNNAPCWSLVQGTGMCTGQTLMVNDLPGNNTAQNENSTVNCSICLPPPNGQNPMPGC